MTEEHSEATAIHAVPAELLPRGFRLLVMRQLTLVPGEPPAFAHIGQKLVRAPERSSRHGVSFAATFRPEVMAWLGDVLGRASQPGSEGRPVRNPRWPVLAWRSEERTWADGTQSTEWLVDVEFPEAAAWEAFRERWAAELAGK